jgi:hypothetical protein
MGATQRRRPAAAFAASYYFEGSNAKVVVVRLE